MNSEEQKLKFILMRESPSFRETAIVKTLEVDAGLYFMALSYMDDTNLCKHFRNMIVLEEYETAETAKKEINRRGIEITFKEKEITFSMKPKL